MTAALSLCVMARDGRKAHLDLPARHGETGSRKKESPAIAPIGVEHRPPTQLNSTHCMRTAPASAAQTLLALTTTGLSVSPLTGLRAPNIVHI